MATVTEFVWDEATQRKIPVTREVKIGVEDDTPAIKEPVEASTAIPASVEAVNESDAVKQAKAAILAAKHALAAAQGKPVGKKGKPKQFHYERVTLGAQVAKDKLDRIKALMPDANNTAIVNLAIDLLLTDLESKATPEAE